MQRDFFRDQELFYAEGCVGRSIVVMQDQSFPACEALRF